MPLRDPINRRQLLQYTGAAGVGIALSASILDARPALAQDEEVDLTFMHWGDLNEKNALSEVIKKFEEANPNISIDQQHVPDDYYTKLNTVAAAGELPDIFHLSLVNSFEWATEGRLLDMTPYVDSTPSFANRMPDTFLYSAPEKTFGTPNAIVLNMLYYNTELFEEAGVAPPPATAADALTWDEFVQVAKAMTKDGSGKTALEEGFDPSNISQYGFALTGTNRWYGLLRSNGGDVADADGTTYTLNSPEAVQVFQNLQDLIHVHHVAPSPAQMENMPATAVQLQSRRVAMTIDGSFQMMTLGESKVPVGVGALPHFGIPLSSIGGALTAINAQTPYIDECVAFWLFHNDPAHTIDLYQRGLWMPLEMKYYTEQTEIEKWTNNEYHPEGFLDAGVDYFLNHSVHSTDWTFKNWSVIGPRVTAGLDFIYSGEKTARQALDDLAPEIQPLLAGRNPGTK
jgi:multiple sugar transport system substrate-binding protein